MDGHATLGAKALIDSWVETLKDETQHVTVAGVGAAVITAHFTAEDSHERAVDAERAATLLARRLRPTDRLGGATGIQLSVLVTPANEFLATHGYARKIDALLFDHCISARTSFAHRRPLESLVDTWARSQAELDRMLYRELHADGICI